MILFNTTNSLYLQLHIIIAFSFENLPFYSNQKHVRFP